MAMMSGCRYRWLVALMAVMLVGCGGGTLDGTGSEEVISFTADDVARFRSLVEEASVAGPGSGLVLDLPVASSGTVTVPVIDLSQVALFNTLREEPGAEGMSLFKVTNDFVNVRSEPRVTATQVGRLERGAALTVLDYPDAAWAHVKLPDGQEGYVSLRHIAKLTAEERLADERKAFEGQYFVDFGFLNVRTQPDTNAEKIGELPGQAIIKPLHLDEVWARIPFNGREGYVARQYLSPFQPQFLVRQDHYDLPILHYRAETPGMIDALVKHLESLNTAGYNFMTLRDFQDHVLEQEERDVRLTPRSIVITVSGITADNIEEISSAFRASSAVATLFIPSGQVGPTGITTQSIQTLRANGFDLASGAHSGDDLRSLTNAQLELEVQQSRGLLEDQGAGQIMALAYPFGGVNERVKEKTASAGYLFGLGNREGTSIRRSEFLDMPNLPITADMTIEALLAKLAPQ